MLYSNKQRERKHTTEVKGWVHNSIKGSGLWLEIIAFIKQKIEEHVSHQSFFVIEGTYITIAELNTAEMKYVSYTFRAYP